MHLIDSTIHINTGKLEKNEQKQIQYIHEDMRGNALVASQIFLSIF